MLKDIQNQHDDRQIPIWKAGIKNLLYPVDVLDRENKVQHTVARVSLFVDLPHHFKGTHMSRFVEVLNEQRGKISLRNIGAILRTMTDRFDCTTAHLEIRFPYFVEKTAPVSKTRSLMDYQCAFLASFDRKHEPHAPSTALGAGQDLIVEVVVPVATLCPCSKEISDQGAHSQRSWITLRVRSHELVWIEELITITEAEASSGLYSLLKREDEKQVTEQAYARPRFAEDMARAVAQKLRQDKRIIWFQVESENMESIHNHNAYAMVVSAKV
ncbi:MAG: GTP cyclohydrolase I FolE2 [Verrucomicrobia bacterium]|nr:GTP cyclohydrolase I FolE2 [Verrucomicrobiota bacterium]MBU1734923.1 GTP cyclohydrolase I FolE2 [Verrucomicrobiota bacterium]MBU1857717.1 GTP cyclohydrolase I FolE2 [Verrucomicrobiota bacterium]